MSWLIIRNNNSMEFSSSLTLFFAKLEYFKKIDISNETFGFNYNWNYRQTNEVLVGCKILLLIMIFV